MKKFFTFCLALLAAMSLQAEEKVVWEGNEPISWNPDVAPGTQYETPQGIFDGLEADNVVRIYTTTTYDEPQYVVTYKKGEGWDWTDLDITTADGILTFTVADDQMAQEIAERGLILRGQCYNIVKITVDAEAQQPIDPPTPAEGEKVVWEGSEPISWNPDVAPGTQFETPEGIFSGLSKGDIVRLYTTTTYDEPQYVVTYKKGEGWDWTDLDITTADDILTFTVADDQMAQEIADRGLIIRGQAFTLVKITVENGSNTGIAVNEESRMKNEELRDAVYDLQGRRMENAQLKKGTFIKNGKKYLVQ